MIRSRYLSPGYWQRSDLTKEAFSQDPDDSEKRLYRTGDLGRLWPDGLLEHLGRKDSRVKIRGYSVELLEVEQALLDLENINDAVVTSWEDHAGDLRLVTYLVPAKQAAPAASELRRALRNTVPAYIIPSSFVILDAMPLNPNGKVNRKATSGPGQITPSLRTPTSRAACSDRKGSQRNLDRNIGL